MTDDIFRTGPFCIPPVRYVRDLLVIKTYIITSKQLDYSLSISMR